MRQRGESGRSAQTKEQLAAQAKATAEQALQLAKLAEESARLAQRLHAQAITADGESHLNIDDPPGDRESASPFDGPFDGMDNSAPAIVTAGPPNFSQVARRRRRSSRTAHRRFQGGITVGPDLSAPSRVQIRTIQHHSPRKRHPVRAFLRQLKPISISTALHIAVLLLLGWFTFNVRSDDAINTVLASFAEEELVEEELPLNEPIEEPGKQQEQPQPEELPPEELPEEPPPEPDEPAEMPPVEPAAEQAEIVEDAPPQPSSEPGSAAAADLTKVGSRSEAGKALLLEKYGGTVESEAAVGRALEWFASRQRADGSWNFNDVGPCGHPGSTDNPMGATAYVLLCYLGAGQTHQQGRFKNNVRAGLTFLLRNGKRVPAGGDFRGPNCREHDNFYVQAPVAMVLIEAYHMTRDRRLGLRQAAQLAVDFLCHAQDPEGGGWRYAPQEPGCTSVTAVVMMALQSAASAGLTVPPRVREGISHYLDAVRSDQAPTGRYGYRVAEPRYKSSTTAMALLCRMYLGWTRENEELQKGVALLDKRGPYDNLYYCYYATQVMRHWGGEEWERWNSVMRDDLVRTQVVEQGPEFGSWTPRDRSGASTAGGRLFITCLATMTLEVYYRYLPLYGLPGELDAVAADPAETPSAAKASVWTTDD